MNVPLTDREGEGLIWARPQPTTRGRLRCLDFFFPPFSRQRRSATGVRTLRTRPTGRRCSRLPKAWPRWRQTWRRRRRWGWRGGASLGVPAGNTKFGHFFFSLVLLFFLVVVFKDAVAAVRYWTEEKNPVVTSAVTYAAEKQKTCTGSHGDDRNKCFKVRKFSVVTFCLE